MDVDEHIAKLREHVPEGTTDDQIRQLIEDTGGDEVLPCRAPSRSCDDRCPRFPYTHNVFAAIGTPFAPTASDPVEDRGMVGGLGPH